MTDPHDDLLDRFLARAGSQPGHPAVVQDGQSVTYGTLERLVRRLAAAIAQAGPHPRVMVHLPQSAEAYAAMLATAMAGGFYAPSNLAAPAERQRMVASRFEPDVVVTAPDLAGAIEGAVGGARFLDPAEPGDGALDAPRPPHALLYVMFTSGSTGVPKGVMLPRAAVNHYVAWLLGVTRGTPDDRWSQHPNLAFDISVTDFCGALCSGATLYPLGSQADRMMPFRSIAKHRLTVWTSVPSVVDNMVRLNLVNPETLASLRLMHFCGEALLPEQLAAVFAARPDLTVHNTYGPTEATVSCTLLSLTRENYRASSRVNVSIGAPIAGMGLHLIGGATEGELAITGPQLAEGYWQDPEATAKAFRSIEIDGERRPAYFTGDWVERSDGQLYFRHRIDHQVKIRGYRLELGEVNAAIRAASIPAAYCALVEGELHAFLQADPAGVDLGVLHRTLKGKLMDYALPRRYHFVEDFPRNANDKVDIGALAEQAKGDAGQASLQP